jgi:hypothetical protein
MGNGGETRHRETGTGSNDNKDLRCKNKGILFSTRAEMGVGSEHNRDLAGRGENTGERQAEVGRTSVVELRGGNSMRDDLLDKGAILMFDSMLGSKGDKSGYRQGMQ